MFLYCLLPIAYEIYLPLLPVSEREELEANLREAMEHAVEQREDDLPIQDPFVVKEVWQRIRLVLSALNCNMVESYNLDNFSLVDARLERSKKGKTDLATHTDDL